MAFRLSATVELAPFLGDLDKIEQRAKTFMRAPGMVRETQKFFRRRMLQTWVERKNPQTGRAWGVGKTKVIDLIDTGDLRRSVINPGAVKPSPTRNALTYQPDFPKYAGIVQARYGFMPTDRQALDYISPAAAEFVLRGRIE